MTTTAGRARAVVAEVSGAETGEGILGAVMILRFGGACTCG